MGFVVYGYLAWLLIMSLITFVFYGWDKRSARLDRQRIPESRLHLYAALGGWPGAIAGRNFFRHKTQKIGFTFITALIVLVHSILGVGLIYWQLQS